MVLLTKYNDCAPRDVEYAGIPIFTQNDNGLEHIMNHADEFAAKGISKNQISGFVMDALENGKCIIKKIIQFRLM